MWKVSYVYNGQRVIFDEDDDINCQPIVQPRGDSIDEAIASVKAYITEIYNCNCLEVIEKGGTLRVLEPSDGELICEYSDFVAERQYELIDSNRRSYLSETPGTFAGHRRLKIYGRLDCPSAARHIAKGEYVQYRVFFADEDTAVAAGYRPCGVCMKEAYKNWKKKNLQER